MSTGTDVQTDDSERHAAEPKAKRPRTPPDSFCGLIPLQHDVASMSRAYSLGVSLAEKLLDKGAKKILTEAKAENVSDS